MKSVFQKVSNQKKIRLGYIIAFLLLFISYIATLYAKNKLVNQAKRVEHSTQIMANLETMLSKLKDGETGVRGYLLTGNVDFLAPYQGAKESTDSLYKVLLKQTLDNTVQQRNLVTLRPDIDTRFFLFDYNLNMFERNNGKITDSLLALQSQSKTAMDTIRVKVADMQAREKTLLGERDATLQKTTKAINLINVISIVLAAALVIFGFTTHTKENKGKQEAQQQMRDYQDQLKQRIEELDKANTELIRMRSFEKFAATGRIARTIAHEVRNPLTNINLAADQLKSELPPNEENTGFLFEMIDRNSNRINQLISELLNSTKFAELTRNKISINDLLDEALKEAQDRISLTNVEVVKKYSTDICDVSVDKEKIKIAMLNIIINGLEAIEGKPGGKLILQTKGESDKCKIVISDNGSGMDEESMSRLFEPYFTSKPKGNGLGLTNTHNIILNHKGDIMVKSKKGEGTTFIISLDFAS